MNIKIPYKWLKEHVTTNATPKQMAKYVSLCGPTFDRTEKIDNDYVYDIEVTTNRVDAMSVHGIAREVAAILPRFGIKAKLKPVRLTKPKSTKNLDIKIKNNPKLGKRILAIKLTDIVVGKSPKWLQEKLIKVDQRPLNNLIDITNYVMWEFGHPIHVFDYDRLAKKRINVREAKKGEKLTTFDNKTITLNGGEVVFDDGTGTIIDLPGIMGTKNTVVTNKTKNILLWIESIDAAKVRKASMSHALRSQAAILNEKSVDPNLGIPTILRAIELYKDLAKAKVGSKLVDIDEKPYKAKQITIEYDFLISRLGVNVEKSKVKSILQSLEFECSWKGNKLVVLAPSFRAHDISIPEDIIEEIARIYGYRNLPSTIMEGAIPAPNLESTFSIENDYKNLLSGLGGNEVYTIALVSKEQAGEKALAIINPLGSDTQYLRTSLYPSLVAAANKNIGERKSFHLFELTNVYLAKPQKLPQEQQILAGILANQSYRLAKGVIETLLRKSNLSADFTSSNNPIFVPSKSIEIKVGGQTVGIFGQLEDTKLFYYEFDFERLVKLASPNKYTAMPKFPSQLEDVTLNLPLKTKVGKVLSTIKSSDPSIYSVELSDIYKNKAFTFTIEYLDRTKTLSNSEVEKIRNKLLTLVKEKHGATVKE